MTMASAPAMAPVTRALDLKKASPASASKPDKESAALNGRKLQVRKLSFDSVVERQQKAVRELAGEDGNGAASSSKPGVEGLPALLKRLRQDAQLEIERATASVSTLRHCLAREILLLERERRECELAHQSEVEALHLTIAAQRQAAEQVKRDKAEVEAELSATERRNDELVAEVARLKREAQQAKEKMDAMEAASAFLEPEAVVEHSPSKRLEAREQMLGRVEEELVGSRSARGAVSLANVPAINGGGGLFEEAVPPEASAPAVRASPASGWGWKAAIPNGTPASSKAASAEQQQQQQQQQQRKLSFGRKGRRLVRSLSFGHERQKPDWGSAAT